MVRDAKRDSLGQHAQISAALFVLQACGSARRDATQAQVQTGKQAGAVGSEGRRHSYALERVREQLRAGDARLLGVAEHERRLAWGNLLHEADNAVGICEGQAARALTPANRRRCRESCAQAGQRCRARQSPAAGQRLRRA